jgi:hypothetical protein
MKRLLAVVTALVAALAGAATRVVQDQCGPFTDISPTICPYVFEIYVLGITAGTSPTTYSPDATVTRGQAAVFVSKGVNQAITRSSRRAALGQWWTTTAREAVSLTNVGSGPQGVRSDGMDLWIANHSDGTVSRVRASDGRLLETWTGASGAQAILVAMGHVFVAGVGSPGKLYAIDPTQPAGPLASVANLDINPIAIAFDGSRIWTANTVDGSNGSVSIIEPGTWRVTNVSGFLDIGGIVWDGASMWVTQSVSVSKLDADGSIVHSVPLNRQGHHPVFDGTNIWVPTSDSNAAEVVVLQAATGTILNHLPKPYGQDSAFEAAAFDGERVAVTDPLTFAVTLWRASDLSLVGVFPLPSAAFGVCSDGVNFWLTLRDTNQLARF